MTKKYLGSSSGLTLVTDAGTAFVSSEFNSGHMVGDIKLATLSDTDDTDVTGTELVTNGTFDSDSNWIKEDGWTISGGVASYASGTGREIEQSSIPTVAGKKYVITFDITSISAGAFGVYSTDTTDSTYVDNYYNSVGTYSRTVTASGSSMLLRIRNPSTGTVGSIDNVTLRLAEEDRSVNNNGLQVFGTVTKTPVATGADLVAYSGFSGSNYLQQPYNSDLDFGTGDFCVMGWVKASYYVSANRCLLARGLLESPSNRQFLLYLGTSNDVRFYGNGAEVVDSPAILDSWMQVCLLRRSGVAYLYINGELKDSATYTGDVDVVPQSEVRIGRDFYYPNVLYNASIALLRISATAPTAEQIAKIYEDEKVLFQEGAQATLYGSSDAVTALAYDDSTELLHVGSSAGRSVFSGLRRVDNTTDAVGACISASNGMVAED